jgi:hypothetical protein
VILGEVGTGWKRLGLRLGEDRRVQACGDLKILEKL